MKKIVLSLTMLFGLIAGFNSHAFAQPQIVAQNQDVIVTLDSANVTNPCGNGASFNVCYFTIANVSSVNLQFQGISFFNLFDTLLSQSTNFYRLYSGNTLISGQNGLNNYSSNFAGMGSGTNAGVSLHLRMEIQPSKCFKLKMGNFRYYNNAIQQTLPINHVVGQYFMCGDTTSCAGYTPTTPTSGASVWVDWVNPGNPCGNGFKFCRIGIANNLVSGTYQCRAFRLRDSMNTTGSQSSNFYKVEKVTPGGNIISCPNNSFWWTNQFTSSGGDFLAAGDTAYYELTYYSSNICSAPILTGFRHGGTEDSLYLVIRPKSNPFIPCNTSCPGFTTGIDNEVETVFGLFPNPASNEINLTGVKEGQLVQIFTIDGRIALQTRFQEGKPIDVSNLSKGIYFLKREDGATSKFVKE